jgi:hypothetical protein
MIVIVKWREKGFPNDYFAPKYFKKITTVFSPRSDMAYKPEYFSKEHNLI